MRTSSRYYVLIGDLVASRLVPDRYALGVQIESTLTILSGRTTIKKKKRNNKRSKKTAVLSERGEFKGGHNIKWFAPLVTTKGIDEISGVLDNPERAFDAAVILNLSIWPQRFRFAFAVGAIDIGVDKKLKSRINASDMDGSAFHRAAEALERARKEKLCFTLALPPDKSDVDCRVVEELADVHDLIMSQWTPRVKEAATAYRRLGNQTRVAREMKISQQAVSDALHRGHVTKLFEIEDVIRSWLSTLG